MPRPAGLPADEDLHLVLFFVKVLLKQLDVHGFLRKYMVAMADTTGRGPRKDTTPSP